MNTVRNEQIFNMQFVQIIKKYPIVYDNTHQQYYHRSDVAKAWHQIAEKAKQQFGAETITADDCRLRWGNLKSCFRRNKFQRLNGAGSKQYYLYKHMMFIDPFIKKKDKQTQQIEENISDIVLPNATMYSRTNQRDTSRCNNLNLQKNAVHVNERFKHRNRKNKITSFQERIISFLEGSYKKEPYDADLQFFKSILPNISEFSPDQKRKLKRGFLQLIDDISGKSPIKKEQ